MTVVIETERLRIRLSRPEDADLHHELWTDPRVMTMVSFPEGIAITVEEIAEALAKAGDEPFDRRLLAELKETGERIGECKLGSPDEDGVAETDVKLLPRHWGHRYGVEIKRALVGYLFEHTDCDSVQGTPNKRNVASIRMQEAVGGVRIGEGVFEPPEDAREPRCPVPHYVYRVYRKDWEAG